MENFEVRPKSFTIKWIDVPDNSTVQWEIKPSKRSINFGIYRYNKNDLSTNNAHYPAQQHPHSSNSLYSSSRNSSAPNSSSTTTSENLSLDEVNAVPHKMFSVLHQNMRDSFDSINSSGINHGVESNSVLGSSLNMSSNTMNGFSSTEPRKRGESFSSLKSSNSENIPSLLEDKMDKHLTKEQWIGRCEGDQLVTGSLTVKGAGLFAFVFDNTFSRHKSKKIMFQQYIENPPSKVMTETVNLTQAQLIQQKQAETSTLPASQPNQLHTISEDSLLESDDEKTKNANDVETEDQQEPKPLKVPSQPVLLPSSRQTVITPSTKATGPSCNTKVQFKLPEKEEQTTKGSTSVVKSKGGQYLQGFLLKKKRRRSGGKKFTKRFFVLNFKYGALDYYLNDVTNNIRGNMYIKNVVISADAKQLMFYLDSGIEQWVLKAFDKDDFNIWFQAFNFIKKQNKQDPYLMDNQPLSVPVDSATANIDNVLDTEIYDEPRVGRSASIQSGLNPHFRVVEEMMASVKDLAENLLAYNRLQKQQQDNTKKPSTERRSSMFWKKMKDKDKDSSTPSTPLQTPSGSDTENMIKTFDLSNNIASTTTSTHTLASTHSPPSVSNISVHSTAPPQLEVLVERIKQLEIQYTLLKNTETSRGLSRPPLGSPSRGPLSRSNTAATSIISQDFFDAQEYFDELNQTVLIVESSEEDEEDEDNEDEQFDDAQSSRKSRPNRNIGIDDTTNMFDDDDLSIPDSISSSSEDEYEEAATAPVVITTTEKEGTPIADDKKEAEKSTVDDLYPLPYTKKIEYRKDINPSVCEPPSLISFLRKNIGKDLSTISMPVSANEPLTFLQKYNESFEYIKLLDDAAESPASTGERILKIACFAITCLSSYRAKMRNNRKPFNPLLGETFELVRNDLGIRVISEKVIHRPAVFAVHGESFNWTIDHVLSPVQKFGGKSAEVSIKGELTLTYKNGEVYKWVQPVTLLKNLIAGEKYSEPHSSITISSNTGYRATVSFKSGGMFSGRSEELSIRATDPKNHQLPLEVYGTWTETLRFKDTDKVVWKAGPLVSNHITKYGFTEFAATLNEITEIDEESAPTDSRWRPDQREYEAGQLDESEKIKVALELDQRKRRKDANGVEVVHKPAFFKQTGKGDLDWEYIRGENEYWNRRKRGDWEGLLKLW